MSPLSLNAFTTAHWTFEQDVDAYARAGFTGMGIYRPKITSKQMREVARRLHHAGLKATSLCIAGFFTDEECEVRLADAREAIHQACDLEAGSVTIVSGPAPHGDNALAEARLCACLEALLPEAEACGVALALEPLHPMYAHMSFLFTLDGTIDLLDRFGSPWLQVVVDLYHLWWDPHLPAALNRAAGQVACVHIADWRNPTRSLNDRARIGQGIIPLHPLLTVLASTGYDGFYEAEMLSDELWASDAEALVQTCYSDLRAVLL